LAFAIQFLVLVLKVTDPEFGLTIFAIFISFFIIGVVVYGVTFLFFSFFFLKHEKKKKKKKSFEQKQDGL